MQFGVGQKLIVDIKLHVHGVQYPFKRGAILSLFSFIEHIFFRDNNCCKKIPDDQIRTWVLCYCQQLFSQLFQWLWHCLVVVALFHWLWHCSCGCCTVLAVGHCSSGCGSAPVVVALFTEHFLKKDPMNGPFRQKLLSKCKPIK